MTRAISCALDNLPHKFAKPFAKFSCIPSCYDCSLRLYNSIYTIFKPLANSQTCVKIWRERGTECYRFSTEHRDWFEADSIQSEMVIYRIRWFIPFNLHIKAHSLPYSSAAPHRSSASLRGRFGTAACWELAFRWNSFSFCICIIYDIFFFF